MENEKVIIAFGAHADDIDLQAGASLAKFSREGYKIIYVLTTTSASGVIHASPNEAKLIRQEEAKQAAKFYQAELVCLNVEPHAYFGHARNKLFYEDSSIIENVTALILKYRPQLIFTHTPDDLHPDHYHTARLVVGAMKKMKAHIRDVRLFLWENGGRGAVIGFQPNTHIEVTQADITIQHAAISAHVSQCQRNPRFETHALTRAKKWGSHYHCEYAEAFVEITF